MTLKLKSFLQAPLTRIVLSEWPKLTLAGSLPCLYVLLSCHILRLEVHMRLMLWSSPHSLSYVSTRNTKHRHWFELDKSPTLVSATVPRVRCCASPLRLGLISERVHSSAQTTFVHTVTLGPIVSSTSLPSTSLPLFQARNSPSVFRAVLTCFRSSFFGSEALAYIGIAA